MAEPQSSIPKGSWVLVTGATGFVGSHTVKAFLERGYKVRGTVRDLKKASWLVSNTFKFYADRGDFELTVVADLGADHAFDEAVRGVSAIAHVASIVTFEADPNKVIPATVAGATGILEAALKEPSVKEFVYTSSIVAATMPVPGNPTRVDKSTWNDFVVEAAWAPPPYDGNRGMFSYMASKVSAEKAVWKFAEERNPHFTINAVLPASIMGEALNKAHNEGGGAWVKTIYDGDMSVLGSLSAFYDIDVNDVALLHAAAVLDPEIKNERLQAWAYKCNVNDILAIMRRRYPQSKFIDNLPDQAQLSISTDFTVPLALLKKWANQDGWKSLEETITDNVDSILKYNQV